MPYEEEIEMGVDESIIRPRKARKNTRVAKQSSGSDKPPARDKFAEERKVVSPLVPLNEQQAEAEQQASSVVLPPYAKRSRKKPEAQQGE